VANDRAGSLRVSCVAGFAFALYWSFESKGHELAGSRWQAAGGVAAFIIRFRTVTSGNVSVVARVLTRWRKRVGRGAG